MARRLKDCPVLRRSSGSVIWAGFGATLGIVPGAGVHDTAEDGAVPGDFQTRWKSEAHPASIKTAANHTAAKKHR
jgi:hypothetical protein